MMHKTDPITAVEIKALLNAMSCLDNSRTASHF
jgi:hypothetical protein